jgi:hypothetical protein
VLRRKGVKNKLWVIIESNGKSLASHPGHDHSVLRPRGGKYDYAMRQLPPLPLPSVSVGCSGWKSGQLGGAENIAEMVLNESIDVLALEGV